LLLLAGGRVNIWQQWVRQHCLCVFGSAWQVFE
jgi:hypothetical protein